MLFDIHPVINPIDSICNHWSVYNNIFLHIFLFSGRRANCILYGILYGLACVTKVGVSSLVITVLKFIVLYCIQWDPAITSLVNTNIVQMRVIQKVPTKSVHIFC